MTERSGPSTIVDVAAAAGVSVATVSRALRGLDRVSPATRERIRKVAEELHYVASPTATSLASGQTQIIGVVVPFPSRWYFAGIVSSIGKALRARGYQVLLFDLERDVFDARLTLTRSMLWKRVDGVISINIPMTEDELDLLGGLHVPIISVGYRLPGRASVGIDDAAAARTATEHIVELGHRDIAFIGAGMAGAALIQTPMSRADGFRTVLREHGIPVREDWVLRTDWTAEHSRELALGLLADPEQRPTAFVCGSDEIAFGVHMAAREHDLRIPHDVSIIGIDDHYLAGVFALTTVRQDLTAQGEAAVTQLLAELAPNGTTARDEQVVLPTELIVRSSTAPPP
ncbi:MAG TPA: LacI family transcriptional regulator [Intrasporangiaceae bacterium]|nr:LacI family transcriptional regulator [Intrasporangiaceae bacterium]